MKHRMRHLKSSLQRRDRINTRFKIILAVHCLVHMVKIVKGDIFDWWLNGCIARSHFSMLSMIGMKSLIRVI